MLNTVDFESIYTTKTGVYILILDFLRLSYNVGVMNCQRD